MGASQRVGWWEKFDASYLRRGSARGGEPILRCCLSDDVFAPADSGHSCFF
jgi:hypothetical protein